MREAFVTVSNIPTHVMTWGKWIEESFTKQEKEVVIMFTGNPGLPGFYAKFLSTVHANIDPNIPIWIIGLAGHDYPPPSSIRKVPDLETNEELFNLDGQIKHKAEFIKKYVPDGVKINLVGHSIGSWITLELLKDPLIKKKVKKCYLVFPTIERMAESSKGKFFLNHFSRYSYWLNLLSIFLSKLPIFLQTMLVYVYFYLHAKSIFLIGTGLKFLQPKPSSQSMFLARDEMKRVKELDVDIIKENQKILKLYYGKTDGWVPINYYHELKEKFPEIDAELDNENIDHAFMFGSSILFGEILAKWINENVNKA